MEFNEDQFILDLIKAQNFKGDPSHGGKLVKKQIIDKNGKKQTEWVRPGDFNKVNKEGSSQDQENELPNTDFVDNLQNEDKAKLELIKEMIDSGDHVNAKQLADSLPDDVKHFIPKDAWKQMYEQEQIETNGVKVEDKKESKKESKLIQGVDYSRKDFERGWENVSDFKNENVTDTVQEFIEGLNNSTGNNKNSRYIGTNREINGKSVLFRISDHTHSYKNVEKDQYLISIVLNDKDGDSEGFDHHDDYSEIRMSVDVNNVEDKLYEIHDILDDLDATTKENNEVKKSQMNIFEKGLDQIKKFFNKAKDIISINEEQEKDSHNKFADTIVFNSNFDILLLKRSKDCKLQPNTWWLPGGHLLESEPPIIGAYRELIEETNIQASLLDFNQVFKTIKKDNKEFNYFTTLIQDKNNPVVTLGEHQSYAWISQQSLFGELNDDFKIAFDNLQLLRDLVTKASKLMSYSVLKQAFNENKISDDQFLKLLKREIN